LAAVIGFEELFRQGQLTVATTYRAFEVYLAVAIVYLVMTSLASFVFKRLEAYMDPINRPRKAKKDPYLRRSAFSLSEESFTRNITEILGGIRAAMYRSRVILRSNYTRLPPICPYGFDLGQIAFAPTV
jgi:hypothetical protein